MRKVVVGQAAIKERSFSRSGRPSVYSYYGDIGWKARSKEGWQNRIGSPTVDQKINCLTHYQESYPQLGEGDGGP